MMEQLKRYWEIAKLALLQEKAAKDSKIKGMNEHEKEFLPAVLEVTEMPPSHAARLLTYVIMLMFKDFFKNNFIASSKISDSDFEKICSDLNEVILPYENDLYFNNKIYHSVIVTSPLADFEEITSLNYLLRNLFMCLSDNFTMNTEVVTLHYEKNSIL